MFDWFVGAIALAAAAAVVLHLVHPEARPDGVVEHTVHWMHDRPGVAPALVIIGIALIAPWVYLIGRRMLGTALLVLAAIAGAEAITGLPNVLETGPPSLWLHAVVAVAVVYLLAKLWLLYRYAGRWNSEPSEADLEGLLPSQDRTIRRICLAVSERVLDEGEHIVQVGGRWGDGKSFLLHRLGPALRRHLNHGGLVADVETRAFAVRRVDVWKAESEPDLHFAIVDDILCHPAYFHPWGWLRYPLLLIPRLRLADLKFKFLGGLAESGVEGTVKMPRLVWQGSLVAAVARVREKKVRTVVVLDEIDRAATSVAQAAVTLMRRALGLAGVTVVLAYVDEVIEYKVFDPLLRQLPDLASSSEVVLSIARDRRLMSNAPQPGQEIDQAWFMVPYSATSADESDRVPPVDLPATLRKGFAGVSELTRRRMRRAMSEKFLSSSPVVVEPLSAEDFAALIVGERYEDDVNGRCPDVTHLVAELLGASTADFPAVRRELERRVREGVDELSGDDPLPPVRPLVGEVRLLLRTASQMRSARPDPRVTLSQDDVVAWILAAFMLAKARLS